MPEPPQSLQCTDLYKLSDRACARRKERSIGDSLANTKVYSGYEKGDWKLGHTHITSWAQLQMKLYILVDRPSHTKFKTNTYVY